MPDDQPLPPDPTLPVSELEHGDPQQPSTDNKDLDTAKEQSSMLDVHPAHHAASTWREFFIHIATIAIGLLLAVGLEQTVEYVHHLRELAEARRELAEEKRFNVEEFRHTAATFQNAGEHLKSYLAALRQSINNPAAPLPVLQVPIDYVYNQYTAWTTAQRDGALTLMPPEEQRGIDRMYVGLHAVDDSEDEAYRAILRAGSVFGSGRTRDETLDFTAGLDPKDLTLEEKKQLYRDLSQALVAIDDVLAVHGVTARFNPELGGGEEMPHNSERAKSSPSTP